jgi:3-oxoacid CoA-transferase
MSRAMVCDSFAEALRDVPAGASVMVPGFGGAGSPSNLLTALFEQGANDLTIIANGVGTPSAHPQAKAVGDLVEAGRVRKVIASFTAGTHPSRVSQGELLVRSGQMEAELVPQGTLAERIRCGGAGIPGFYTPAGVGTLLAEAKEHRRFGDQEYVLEEALTADYALIHAWKADTAGNLVFRHAARNFNPIMAMAARHTIVEVEEPILPAGALSPDEIHTPGVYVERLVHIPVEGFKRVARAAAPAPPERTGGPVASEGRRPLTRAEIAAVLGRRMGEGWIGNLGVGLPTLASSFVDPAKGVVLTSENGVIGYGGLAGPEDSDPDIVNAGGQPVTLIPGGTFVHHADSFALIRRGFVDVTVLGAYEVAADGSFANWRTTTEPWDQLGGIGGAMDLVASAKQIWIGMEHTTRDGRPRLLEHCTLPVTSPRGVTLVATDLAVIAVRDGRFTLEEHAPGYTVEEIRALTGAPLDVSPDLRPIELLPEG